MGISLVSSPRDKGAATLDRLRRTPRCGTWGFRMTGGGGAGFFGQRPVIHSWRQRLPGVKTCDTLLAGRVAWTEDL